MKFGHHPYHLVPRALMEGAAAASRPCAICAAAGREQPAHHVLLSGEGRCKWHYRGLPHPAEKKAPSISAAAASALPPAAAGRSAPARTAKSHRSRGGAAPARIEPFSCSGPHWEFAPGLDIALRDAERIFAELGRKRA